MSERVKVERNIMAGMKVLDGRHRYAWLVICPWCDPAGNPPLYRMADIFGGPTGKIIGGTDSWQVAVNFASDHASDHQANRCPTCGHVPKWDELERA